MTPRENMIAFFKGEPVEWIPVSNTDLRRFQPAFVPEYVARGFVSQQQPFDPANYGGPDWFGVDWKYDPVAGGSMETGHILEDISEWEDVIVFPDLDAIDWEGHAKANAEYLNTDMMLGTMIFTGFFERLLSFLGYENAAIAMIDEEQQEDVERLFDRLADFYIDYLLRMNKHFGVEFVTLHDDWGTQRSLAFSKEIHAQMIEPRIRRVIKALHDNGIYYEQHSCGCIEPLIPTIIDTGADTWFGQMNANLDKYALVQKYGDQFKFGVSLAARGGYTDEEARVVLQEYLDKYKGYNVWYRAVGRIFTPAQMEMFREMCKVEK